MTDDEPNGKTNHGCSTCRHSPHECVEGMELIHQIQSGPIANRDAARELYRQHVKGTDAVPVLVERPAPRMAFSVATEIGRLAHRIEVLALRAA